MLLGLAIGDALGNTTESLLPRERQRRFGEITSYLPNPHADGRAVGLPSDDTQMAGDMRCEWEGSMPILVTGFNPFALLKVNSSELAVRALAAAIPDGIVETRILRTEFDCAGGEIVRLIRQTTPHAVICCGVRGGDNWVRLERYAYNWDTCAAPDNAGKVRVGQTCVAAGPESYRASFNYEKVSVGLAKRDIPHAFSDDPGRFVCNHVFYRACHEIARSGGNATCGFVHLPNIAEAGVAGLPLPVLVEALMVCVNAAEVSHPVVSS